MRDLDMPDFMFQCRMEAIPPIIEAFRPTWVGVTVALVVPTVLAFIIGAAMFLRRIKGVYFSIFTQAVLMAFFILVSNQRSYTGGVDGLTTLNYFNLFDHYIREDSVELF